jgi:hypothetical protein
MKEEEKVMEHLVLYRSRPTAAAFSSALIFAFSVTISFILLDATQNYFYLFGMILFLVLTLVLISVRTMFRYSFYHDFYQKVTVLLGMFNVNKKNLSYASILCLEVRKRDTDDMEPLVILYFNEKQLKSRWFEWRSFVFNWNNPETLIPLLTYLKEQTEVKIKINIAGKFREQYKLLKPFDNFSK